jgi:hypothetical protein
LRALMSCSRNESPSVAPTSRTVDRLQDVHPSNPRLRGHWRVCGVRLWEKSSRFPSSDWLEYLPRRREQLLGLSRGFNHRRLPRGDPDHHFHFRQFEPASELSSDNQGHRGVWHLSHGPAGQRSHATERRALQTHAGANQRPAVATGRSTSLSEYQACQVR